MTEVLTRRALNRALLARQHLLERSDRHSPVQMVEHLVGMQAQYPMAPYTGLWSRIAGFDPHALARALEERGVVRMNLMRATIHLVSARDARFLAPLVQPMRDRVVQGSFAGRIAGLDRAALVQEVVRVTTQTPMMPSEIARHLQARFPDHDEQILGIVAVQWAPMLQATPRGVWGRSGQPRVTPLDAWLGPADDPRTGRPGDDGGGEDDLGALFLRYLGACGPATVADFRAWSRLTRVDRAVGAVARDLRRFEDERGRTLYDLPDAPRPDPATPAAPRILPVLDNLLLSHEDRTRVIAREHGRATFNGTAFLVDGFVAGTWKLTAKARTTTFTLSALTPIAQRDRARLEREAAELLAFLEPAHAHVVTWAPG